eukprot:TRINITY_DN25819_c0_g1_i1.p1 TRINITY_DN25819_c0_g1~~TRINITY_DN25819_c0_g1_i1.p1  ORF type:complete len:898 (+),score=261.43 TRINITY_DN25819_c0_g1_i1:130-2823(+)
MAKVAAEGGASFVGLDAATAAAIAASTARLRAAGLLEGSAGGGGASEYGEAGEEEAEREFYKAAPDEDEEVCLVGDAEEAPEEEPCEEQEEVEEEDKMDEDDDEDLVDVMAEGAQQALAVTYDEIEALELELREAEQERLAEEARLLEEQRERRRLQAEEEAAAAAAASAAAEKVAVAPPEAAQGEGPNTDAPAKAKAPRIATPKATPQPKAGQAESAMQKAGPHPKAAAPAQAAVQPKAAAKASRQQPPAPAQPGAGKCIIFLSDDEEEGPAQRPAPRTAWPLPRATTAPGLWWTEKRKAAEEWLQPSEAMEKMQKREAALRKRLRRVLMERPRDKAAAPPVQAAEPAEPANGSSAAALPEALASLAPHWAAGEAAAKAAEQAKARSPSGDEETSPPPADEEELRRKKDEMRSRALVHMKKSSAAAAEEQPQEGWEEVECIDSDDDAPPAPGAGSSEPGPALAGSVARQAEEAAKKAGQRTESSRFTRPKATLPRVSMAAALRRGPKNPLSTSFGTPDSATSADASEPSAQTSLQASALPRPKPPAAAKAEGSKLVAVAKPAVAKPAVAKPAVAKPAVAKPAVAKFAVAKSAIPKKGGVWNSAAHSPPKAPVVLAKSRPSSVSAYMKGKLSDAVASKVAQRAGKMPVIGPPVPKPGRAAHKAAPKRAPQAKSEPSVNHKRSASQMTGLAARQGDRPEGATAGDEQVDHEGRPFDFSQIVVNFLNVGATYGCKVLKRANSKFDYEGVRKCVAHLTQKRGMKVIGVIFENHRAVNEDGSDTREVPMDIVHMCESIEYTPRISGQHQKSADDEMTIKLAYRRNCLILDNDNYRDWKSNMRDDEVRTWLERYQDVLQVRFYFDSALGTFDTLDGNFRRMDIMAPTPPATLSARNKRARQG